MNFEVTTFGGGYPIFEIFNGIAIIAKGASFMTLLKIMGGVGLVCFCVMASMGRRISLPIKHILVYAFILNIVILKTATVLITDKISGDSYTIDNVPIGIAAIAGITSTIGTKLATLFEDVFHLPDDMAYTKTGMVFGAQVWKSLHTMKIQNPALIANLNAFANHCILIDTGLNRFTHNRYSLADLRASKDMWSLLKAKSSKHIIRFNYSSDGSTQTKDAQNSGTMTCSKGAEQLEKDVVSELPITIENLAQQLGMPLHTLKTSSGTNVTTIADAAAKAQIVGVLSSTFSTMQGIASDAEKTLRNAMTWSALLDATASPGMNYGFAKAMISKSTNNWITSRLAGYWLPLTRDCFCGLLYASFLIVVILALTPFGRGIFVHYIESLVWLQLWPLCFVILNFFASSCMARLGVASVGTSGGISAAGIGHMGSVGSMIAGLAGYLSLSVPFLARGLMKGMMGTFTQIAQSIGGATQSAIMYAANEVASGNLSVGNASLFSQAANNLNSNNLNTGSNIHMGGGMYNFGSPSTASFDAGGGLNILTVAQSHMPGSIGHSETINQRFSELSASETRASEENSLAIAQNMRQVMANSHELNSAAHEGGSTTESWTTAKSARWVEEEHQIDNIIKHISEKNNVSRESAHELFFKVVAEGHTPDLKKFGIYKVGAEGGYNWHGKSLDTDSVEKLLEFSRTNTIQNLVEDAKQYSHDVAEHADSGHTKSLADDMSSRLENTAELDKQRSEHLSKAKSYNQQAEVHKDDTLTYHVDDTDDFIQKYDEEHPKQQFETLSRKEQTAAMAAYAAETGKNFYQDGQAHVGTGQQVVDSYQAKSRALGNEGKNIVENENKKSNENIFRNAGDLAKKPAPGRPSVKDVVENKINDTSKYLEGVRQNISTEGKVLAKKAAKKPRVWKSLHIKEGLNKKLHPDSLFKEGKDEKK